MSLQIGIPKAEIYVCHANVPFSLSLSFYLTFLLFFYVLLYFKSFCTSLSFLLIQTIYIFKLSCSLSQKSCIIMITITFKFQTYCIRLERDSSDRRFF